MQPNSPKLSCVETPDGVRKSVSHTPTPPPITNGASMMHPTSSTPTATSPAATPTHDRVAILDCGAQYGKVIDRRVREMNVEGIMLPLATPAKVLKEGGYKCVFLLGCSDPAEQGDHHQRRSDVRQRPERAAIRLANVPPGHSRARHMLRLPGARVRRST